MEFKSCKKLYRKETHRIKSPEETFEIVEPLTEVAGITRVADITKLDRLNIPVFSCIRPGAADGAISVYNGKGVTPIAARVSAIMEGMERYSAELQQDDQLVTGKYPVLAEEFEVLDPVELILPEAVDPDAVIPWTPAYEILFADDGETLLLEELLVPAAAIYHPLPSHYYSVFRTGTNGIASGNALEEATFHAMCEVIERDAWSLCEAEKTGGRLIVDIDDADILNLINTFKEAGVDVFLRDITSDIGLPTIAAIADDVELKDPTLLCLGMGTHSSPKIAALRALTEVAQSRATQIHGAREDATIADVRKQIGYDRTKRLNAKWFDESATVQWNALKDISTDDFLDEIKNTVRALNRVGLQTVIVKDLTRPELGIPVVHVIIPGIEAYAIDSDRMGVRCKAARSKAAKTGGRVRKYVRET
ncbi:YcaO-related McrA-glycine thioamidation protein [Methanimicrococcus blatticola]|uniref:Ribosomal protein S12 methylthiotransferase accessory factor n=1 Tax=Methanimicrococcus blatticola TaxID=91560 RepID=A0A484F4W8_9EURY|nr:YcaO-related McrA-glycine thioamidation protein [Methanimicrococcus blatticola]MBZ3935624.1 YcaO-related McrA-glycine thioamidation protein [Methanimicrococcus blatticola]MCC2509265.1 YcaO-related McrA-glycine thioamidation protein [Methanimicrococcus blatticola]TDQ69370.1 ribosomal protein S12 methylthiotransferase accessory factor [Methanimicrococcus blatticola]